MDPKELAEQIRIEQLRYLYNADVAGKAKTIHYSEKHIPEQYIFNNKRRRIKSNPHYQDLLYCRPFYVLVGRKKYCSHTRDGVFTREALRVLPKTEEMLMVLTKITMSKVKQAQGNQQDLFMDVYCGLLEKFRQVDVSRSPAAIFGYLITLGINVHRRQNKSHLKWDFYNHSLTDAE